VTSVVILVTCYKKGEDHADGPSRNDSTACADGDVPSAYAAAGLRSLQIWVPDTRSPDFAEICRRQAVIVAKGDLDDASLRGF
jgi:hypothetical protein